MEMGPALGVLPGLGLILLGTVIYFWATAYQFTGLLCIAAGVLMGCFAGIHCLSLWHVTAAKILQLILTSGILLGLLAASVTGCRIAWAAEGHAGVNCRYLVVLGAGVEGTVPSRSLRERLDAACAYLTAHPQTICVVSGGQGGGEDITEAACMYQELVRRGIAPERIWMEEQAGTTLENLRFSLDLIEARTGSRPGQIGLVSSEYHLYRAGRIAEGLGVSAVGIPAKTSFVFLRINYFLREIAAVWYYTISGGF